MPELPEVETVCRGLTAQLPGRCIQHVHVRQPSLRWNIPPDFAQVLTGRQFTALSRRGKYLLMSTDTGTLIAHLGMSGSFRVVPATTPLKKHDHVIFALDDQRSLRYHDPRRFGSLHWVDSSPLQHPLLVRLGPEPLDAAFTADALFSLLQPRKKAVKACLMDHHLVVGVGNIYATEALFKAGVHPQRPAFRVRYDEAASLHQHIQSLLRQAIQQGGTTLRDFVNADAQPGYFQQTLFVYGREQAPCHVCQTPLQSVRITQRSSVFCPRCQS